MKTPTPNDLTLALDTASPIQSLALTRGHDILFESISRSVSKDGPGLLTLVDTALKYCHLNIKDLDRLVVSRGPGAFTGLRVSMAMLKAFAMTLDIPLYAGSTLNAIARNTQPFQGIIAPCIDARRGEIYTAFYQQKDGKLIALTDEMLVTPADFIHYVDSNYPDTDVLCIGPAFPTYRSRLNTTSARLHFTDMPVPPRAAALAFDALETHPDSLPDIPIEALEPKYIRLEDFAMPKPFDFTQPTQYKHNDTNHER